MQTYTSFDTEYSKMYLYPCRDLFHHDAATTQAEAGEPLKADQVFRFPPPVVPQGDAGTGLVDRFLVFLRQSGYEESAICRKIKSEDELLDFETVMRDPQQFAGDDLPSVLMRLFLRGEVFPKVALPSCLPDDAVEVMRGLGVLIDPPELPGKTCASCALYPTRGMYMASDRWYSPTNTQFLAPADVVFPAISRVTHGYMNALPKDPCENFLEICSGTGIAAIYAAKHFAKQSWAVDIEARSTEYAEFNVRLNRLENVKPLTGDLYAPVRGKEFDVIAAHPPYVPTMSGDAIYADGGPDGERITRGVIQGIFEFLSPGGVCYCMTLGTDRKDAPFEQRVREWLGPAAAICDVAFFARQDITPTDFATQRAIQYSGGTSAVDEWKRFFKKQGIEELVKGLIVVKRHASPRRSYTTRRFLGDLTTRNEVQWQLRAEEAALDAQFLDRLRKSRLWASAHLELNVHHRLQDRQFVPDRVRLEIEYPFAMECKVEPWTAAMLALCDGLLTPSELLQACKRDGIVRPDTPEDEFLAYLKTLVLGGFLESDALPLPVPHERNDHSPA
jgi:SAM-dependent methyltransferase